MSTSDALKWSAQLAVAPPIRTRKLPGDKILLPPSALEQLLAAAPTASISPDNRRARTQFDPFNPYGLAAESGTRELTVEHQHPLPHPLTFRLVNPRNGRAVHAGIREFSAEENEVGLSLFLRETLGFRDADFRTSNIGAGEDLSRTSYVGGFQNEKQPRRPDYPTVTVHAMQLPKGTYVRLRPLEAGYDFDNWKALLERYLRENFTTLTTGELLSVPGGRSETFRFLVDKVLPEGDGICIVDTDLEVDIEALNEEQARETLKRRLAKATRAPGTNIGSSAGGKLTVGQEVSGQIIRGEYVDYEMHEWDRGQGLDIEVDVADGADVDVFASPLSSRQRARPRDNEHVFGDLSNKSPKRIQLQPTNVELEDAEAIFISVYAYSDTSSDGNATANLISPSMFSLRTRVSPSILQPMNGSKAGGSLPSPEDTCCENCHQLVPRRTFFLHENFCLRNNTLCPKCQTVFQKRSPEWENHWHCPNDEAYGNDASSKLKHDSIFHSPYSCASCQFQAPSLPALAYHRTSTCPGKLILCQFCHLIVPQQGDSDPDVLDPEVLLSGLTPHELVDGGRTTECHMCNKIIRLRDMKTHLRHHDLDRLSRHAPRICKNPNCGRTVDGRRNLHNAASTAIDSLGLCNVCSGPLYADVYDPEGKALRRRIERRYLTQMLAGCGKPWCRNKYCKTGRANAGTGAEAIATKDALALVKPLVDEVTVNPGSLNAMRFYFCADETSQRWRELANTIAAEAGSSCGLGYDIEWCVAAVEVVGGDLAKARDWLKNWAPGKGEVIR